MAVFYFLYTRVGIRFLPGQGRNEISPEDIEVSYREATLFADTQKVFYAYEGP